MKSKIEQIKPELRDLLNEFLLFEDYQPIFKGFAEVVGYHGNKIDRIRSILFIPNDKGEIGFSISGMDELFTEFQLIKQLADKEPYKTLLDNYPKAIQNIRRVAIKMLNKEDIGEEDLLLIFNTEQYEQDNSSK